MKIFTAPLPLHCFGQSATAHPIRLVILFARSVPIIVFILLASACSSGPDESILEERLAATINLGWGWITAENVDLQKSEDLDNGVLGTFSYTLVIQKDAHLLPQEAIATFRTHVPQCESVPIQKGKRCTLEETLFFVESSTFGWVPEVVLRQRPELLEYIAENTGE